MASILAKRLDQIELVSDYLDDTCFYVGDISINSELQEFILRARRVYWEEPDESRLLGFIPYIKYHGVGCDVVIASVETMDFIKKKRPGADPQMPHFLDEIEADNHHVLLQTYYFDILLSLRRFDRIEVRDISEVTERFPYGGIGRRMGFNRFEELEKLKTDVGHKG